MENQEIGLALRTDLTVLEVIGDKAAELLQGQLCCDVSALSQSSSSQVVFSACCDHKGRMIANFWVWQQNDKFYLLLPKTMLALTQTHLQKFAVFSKVILQETSDWQAINYSGQDSSLPFDFTDLHIQIPMDIQPPRPLHWLIGKSVSIAELWKALTPLSTIINENGWKYLSILAKLAFLQPQTSGLFIPQMIGLDNLGGISFNKGCYVGQEIVARTHHLGQLKRHLQSFLLYSSKTLSIGQSLQNQEGEVIGQIIESALENDQNYRILAVIQDRALPYPILIGNNLPQ